MEPEDRKDPLRRVARDVALEDLVSAWWSRYCPTCETVHPATEQICPDDGATLRDLSISTTPLAAAATSDIAPETLRTSATESMAGVRRALDARRRRTVPTGKHVPKILGGKWRVPRPEEPDGGGTFGFFYEGYHNILGMKVGIKVLRHEYTATEEGRRLFHQEAMRVSLLNHPNIVKVLDYGVEETTPYLVMEYLTGRPLHHLLAGDELSLEERVEAIRQVAIALENAHKGGSIEGPLVHLDLKPEHVFLESVDDQLRVKVIDFGIAEIAAAGDRRASKSGSREARIAGTLPYMAPERWDGAIEPRCDIYSLGVMLYEVVSGRKPFESTNPAVMQRLHLREEPRPPSTLRSGPKTALLKELDAIVLEALDKDPNKRPESAAKFAESLKRWLERPRLHLTQRLARAAILPLGIVLILGLGFVYWGPWERVSLPPGLESEPRLLGPASPDTEIRAVVVGIGYEGTDGTLLVTKEGRSSRIPLERVSASSVTARFGWKDLAEALGETLTSGECQATIRFSGWLGRSVDSESFTVLLDREPPGVEVRGPTEEDGVLWCSVENAEILAGEPLQVERLEVRSWLNGAAEPVIGRAIDTQTTPVADRLQFRIPRGTCRIEVRAADRAGNVTERSWDVKWITDPHLIVDRLVRTNEPEVEVPFRVGGGTPGRVEVDGKELEGTGAYRYEVSFDEQVPGLQEKEITVRMWSEFSASRGGAADVKDTIRVAYLKRDLVVEPRMPVSPAYRLDASEAGSSILPAFRVVDSTGEAVTDSSLSCQVVLKDGERNRRIENVGIDSESGRLVIPGGSTLRGECIVTLIAEDPYGNTADHVEIFLLNTLEPEVRFELASTLGTEARKLHHADCPCRGGKREGTLGFRLDAGYRFPDRLEARVVLVGDDVERGGVVLAELLSLENEAELQVPLDKLLGYLRPGKNTLRADVRDTANPDMEATPTCDVHVYPPLMLTVEPESSEVPREVVEITVRPEGPPVSRVEVDGVVVAPGADGVFRRGVSLPPAGVTTVAIGAWTEEGCFLGEERKFWRPPIPGGVYVFELGDRVGTLRLKYFPGSDELPSFWCTPDEEYETLRRRFRADSASRGESSSRAARTSPPDSWYEAAAVAAWVSEALRASGSIAGDQEVRLPKIQHLRALWSSGMLPCLDPAERYEWLESEGLDRAEYVQSNPNLPDSVGKTGLADRDWPEQACMFRLVLSHQVSEHRVHPRYARSVAAAHEKRSAR